MGNGFESRMVLLLVSVMLALLIAAIAVQAAVTKPIKAQNCSDSIQNQDETGVDCGGVCTTSAKEVCDGIDNDKDCYVDEGDACNAATQGSSGSRNGVGIAAVDEANENKEPFLPKQAAQPAGIQPTESESALEGVAAVAVGESGDAGASADKSSAEPGSAAASSGAGAATPGSMLAGAEEDALPVTLPTVSAAESEEEAEVAQSVSSEESFIKKFFIRLFALFRR